MTPLNLLHAARFRVVAICLGLLLAQSINQLFLWSRAAADRETGQQAAQMQRRLADIPQILRLQNLYKGLDWTMAVNALGGDPNWNQKAQEAVSNADKKLGEQLATLQGVDPEVVKTIREELNRASRHAIGAVDMMRRNDLPSAELSAQIYRDSLDRADQLLYGIVRREQAALEAVQDRLVSRSSRTLVLYGVMTLVSFVLGAALILLVFRSYVRPLGRAVKAIRQINAGAATVELPEPTHDEFGEMAAVLRQFVSQTEHLRALAYTDELTGLASRARVMMDLAAAQPDWDRSATALIYLDLDNFRALNESLGHQVGDSFLVEVANRLRSLLPADAIISRFSGDEFVILINGQPNDESLVEGMLQLSDRVLLGIAAPYTYGDQQLTLSASIGIALAPRDGFTSEDLLASASAAVNLAKRSGRNNTQFTSNKLTEAARRQITLLSDIRRGIDLVEFEPFYQPIVNVVTGKIEGAEALLRWRHPVRGVVFPLDFIRTAEDSGLIGMLGNACLEKVCVFSRTLKQQNRNLPLCVNLSARQLDDEKIISSIESLCAQHQILPAELSFEITESAVMRNPERNLRVLTGIRALGHRLSVDDFGTGYSSLSYLERFPVDRIKIDRSFVVKIESSKATRAIVSATVTLASKLGLDVVAEGVDAPEQTRILADLGCALQQGFLYAQALPPDEFSRWVAKPPKLQRA